MDDFEKLGRLVGASVEAVPGKGLPRTRAEARALGLPRYFTGKPCKRGHVAERYVSVSQCVECKRQFGVSQEHKERERQYRARPDVKERKRQHNAKYKAKPEVAERERQRKAKPEVRERNRQYDAKYNYRPEVMGRRLHHRLKRAGDAALFAINQAMWAATRAIAPADIVPQCPEPHRSQLQALVDRIRADPTAGKAVVGLLRTMRELRKLELAEQNTQDDTTASSP